MRRSPATDLSSEEVVKDIRRATRKRYSAKEKIRMVLDGLRGEHSIAEHQRWVPRLRSSLNNGHFST